MNTKQTPETLPSWVTPRLMRLNQADGTDKHLTLAESVFGTGLVNTGASPCVFSQSGSGNGVACGPS